MANFDEYLNYFRDAIRAFSKKRINFSENSFLYALGQAAASLAAKNDAAVANMEKRLSLLKATGTDLDDLFSNFNIIRKSETQASGHLTIWASSLPSTRTIIPAGTAVSDTNGNQFITTEDAIIPSNINHYPDYIRGSIVSTYYALPINVDVDDFQDSGISLEEIRQQFEETTKITTSSVDFGVDQNIGAEEISTTISGNLTVINYEPFSGGTENEIDELFRARGLSIIRGANSKFTNESLEGFVLSQDGVIDAVVVDDNDCLTFTPPDFGKVYLIINTMLVFNDQPSAGEPVSSPRNIYENIRNLIEDQGWRPAGIGMVVQEADVRNVGFKTGNNLRLDVTVDPSTTPSLKKEEIRAALFNYFSSVRIGQDIYKSDVIKVIKSIDGVKDISAFTFLNINGRDASGNPVYTEVEFLDAAQNQVFRIKTTLDINIEVTEE